MLYNLLLISIPLINVIKNLLPKILQREVLFVICYLLQRHTLFKKIINAYKCYFSLGGIIIERFLLIDNP
jgi:hypothetical protein